MFSRAIVFAAGDFQSEPWLEKIEGAFCRIAGKRIASIILIGFLALAARLAILP